MRKVAGIAFLLYCGFALFFVLAYVIGSTQFDLPPGPPIVVVAPGRARLRRRDPARPARAQA